MQRRRLTSPPILPTKRRTKQSRQGRSGRRLITIPAMPQRVNRRVAEWSITKSWAIEPPSGAGYDAAYMVRIEDETGTTRELVVEFAAPSALASVGYAEEIARRFRHGADPPRHVIVDLERTMRVVRNDPGDSGVPAEDP